MVSSNHVRVASGGAGTTREVAGPSASSQPFGSRNGPGVLNGAQVLQDTWAGLGHRGPPKVAVIYVEPFADHRLSSGRRAGSGSTFNPFGHTAVALEREGKLVVANVVGCATPSLLNFFSAEDYFFSTDHWTAGLEQGGVYNRCFRMLALWDVPAHDVARLDAFLVDLDAKSRSGEARYNMNRPLSLNRFGWLSRRLPGLGLLVGETPHYGNCASFSAEGLRAAGVGTQRTMWPKQVLLHAQDKNPDAKLITFSHASSCPLDYGRGAMRGSFISPRLRDVPRGIWDYDLTSKSDAVVCVDPQTQLAHATFRG